MLYFNDASFIFSAFLLLMPSVVGFLALGAVGRRIWVEDPYIEECAFLLATPEALSSDVLPGIIFFIGCSVLKGFPGQGLDCWLNFYILADYGH